METISNSDSSYSPWNSLQHFSQILLSYLGFRTNPSPHQFKTCTTNVKHNDEEEDEAGVESRNRSNGSSCKSCEARQEDATTN